MKILRVSIQNIEYEYVTIETIKIQFAVITVSKIIRLEFIKGFAEIHEHFLYVASINSEIQLKYELVI